MPAQSRPYVDPKTNEKVDAVHLRVMAHCGYRISKTDFINTVLEIGLSNETALFDAFPVMPMST